MSSEAFGAGAFPHRPEQMTPEWLTQALAEAGQIKSAKVEGFTTEPVGNGMLGDSLRFTLAYDKSEEGALESVVGKFATENETGRQTGLALGIYESEIRFYRELASTVDIRVPDAHYANMDKETGNFLVLMEDLGPARGGNQLTGCSLADARQAMLQAAALHGPRWNDESLAKIRWMTERAEKTGPTYLAALPACFAEFRNRYEAEITAEHLRVCEVLIEKCVEMAARIPKAFTIIHSDFRLDNMLFDIQGGSEPLAVVDWQTPSIGTGAQDVGYFLSAGISVEDRRQHDEELLSLYLEALRGYGVRDYSMAMLREEVAATSLSGAMTAIYAAIGTGRTERGDKMFLTMLRGSCQQALDYETLRFLG